MQNGVHNDSISPATITQWVEFLEIFVARKVPEIPALFVGPSSPFIALLGGKSDPIDQSAYADLPNVAAAERAFRRDNARVRLMMDNGAGPSGAGGLGTTWEMKFESWPPRTVKARSWYLDTGGKLSNRRPPGREAVPLHRRPGRQTDHQPRQWRGQQPQPNYDWAPVADGKGLGFTTGPLARDTVIAGGSSLSTWIRSSKRRIPTSRSRSRRSGLTARRSTCRPAGCVPLIASCGATAVTP